LPPVVMLPAARGVELVGRPTRGDFMVGLIAVR
jgi:hypothetical protein